MIVAGVVVDVQDADKALQDEQTKRKEREMEDLIKHELKMEKMQEQIDELEESEARLLKERNAEKLRADNTLKALCRTAPPTPATLTIHFAPQEYAEFMRNANQKMAEGDQALKKMKALVAKMKTAMGVEIRILPSESIQEQTVSIQMREPLMVQRSLSL